MPSTTDGVAGVRLAVGHTGGLGPMCAGIRRSLTGAGALVLPLCHPSWSAHALQANRFAALAYLGCDVRPGESSVCYFQGRHYVSEVGSRLAECLAESLEPLVGSVALRGMALPVLRDSAMPAVLLRFASAPLAATVAPHVAEATLTSAQAVLAQVDI